MNTPEENEPSPEPELFNAENPTEQDEYAALDDNVVAAISASLSMRSKTIAARRKSVRSTLRITDNLLNTGIGV